MVLTERQGTKPTASCISISMPTLTPAKTQTLMTTAGGDELTCATRNAEIGDDAAETVADSMTSDGVGEATDASDTTE